MTAKALLIGATGPLGREILAQARAQGIALRALARNPAALAGEAEVLRGDALDPESLRRAAEGMEAVISVLGTGLSRKPVTLLSEGTRNLVGAMRAAGTRRLLCVTGMGAGDSRGHGGFVYDRLVLPTLLRQVYADKDRQEAVVRESGLDWTLIRPARLTESAGTGRWREIAEFAPGERMTSIPRADVARFLLRELGAPRYGGRSVNLTA